MKEFLKIFQMSLFGFSITILFGCDTQNGFPGISQNIIESKKREVFICQYEPVIKVMTIDSIKFEIEEVWLEKSWRYDKRFDNGTSTRFTNNEFQLKINFTKNMKIKNYSTEWVLGKEADHRKRFRYSGHYSLMLDLKHVPADSLIFGKYSINKDNGGIGDSIGELRLIKKKIQSNK